VASTVVVREYTRLLEVTLLLLLLAGNVLSVGVLEKAMGRKPVYYRDGGTIPALAYFQQVGRITALVCPCLTAFTRQMRVCWSKTVKQGSLFMVSSFHVVLLLPLLLLPLQILNLNSTVFAFGLGDHIHAPNERLLEHLFHTGRQAWVEYLAVLGEKLAGLLPADAPVHRSSSSSSAAKEEL
jgi:hypothetical protein